MVCRLNQTKKQTTDKLLNGYRNVYLLLTCERYLILFMRQEQYWGTIEINAI